MTTEMQVPRPLYHLLTTTITQIVLAMGAILILLPIGLLGHLSWSMVSILLAYNVIVATLLAVILTNRSAENKTPVLKGEGLVIGHFVGLFLGAFIGIHLGGTAIAIGSAALLYFAIGWLGSKISFAVGTELDRLASSPQESANDRLIRSAARRNMNSLFVYGAAIPAVFLLAAVFVKSSGLTFPQYPEILPTARMVLVALSLLSILIPWLRRSHRMRHQGTRRAGEWAVFFAGLGLALAPAICGFVVFVASGMSITELSLFALAASLAVTTWATSRARN